MADLLFPQNALTPLAPPQTFHPTYLLPRANLPLAFLDPTPCGSRLFTGSVRLLDAVTKGDDGDKVLIASNAQNNQLFAIERIKPRCYSLCNLGQWVSKDMLRRRLQIPVRDPLQPQVKRRLVEPTETQDQQEWWRRAAVSLPAFDSNVPVAQLPPVLHMGATDKSSSRPNSKNEAVPGEEIPSNEPIKLTTDATVHQDPFEELAKQYLDALYLSRTSLAYFTKGPLSRARVAASSSTPASDSFDLTSFLRNGLLITSAADKKYRESIPAIIKELMPVSLVSPEKPPEKTKKRRSKWKSNRTKAGFLTIEKDFVEQWWRRHDDEQGESISIEKIDVLMRRRVDKLRNRETFLQIILVLEILALEEASGTTSQHDMSAAKSGDDQELIAESQHTPKAKKPSATKKMQHLPTHLEALLDKLCIWFSLESQSPAKKRSEHDQSDGPVDELKNFCVEVVIPFFSSRIPQYTALVNRKFGGPTAPSPVKRTTSKSGRPGVSNSKAAPTKLPRKSVSNSLSEASAPFQRSAAPSQTPPIIKREGSEMSLSSIPLSHVPPAPVRGSSLAAQLQQFSKREVDLNAVHATTEARIRKKKDVETKLKEAVEMLKKPNRALAVKENESRVDERFVKATTTKARSRPSQNQQPPQKQDASRHANVHITETPSHNRTIKATPRRPFEGNTSREKSQHSSGSYTTHVPYSAIRTDANRFPPVSVDSPSFSRTTRPKPGDPLVQSTPSRGFAKFMPAGLSRAPGTFETPIVPRTFAAIEQTPSKSIPALGLSPSRELSRNTMGLPDGANVKNESVPSIYDTLGWNEDEYEELR